MLCYNAFQTERGMHMAVSTKEAFAMALKKMMSVKPMEKITVKDLVEICGVNRQTFYYHFDDIFDLLEWVFEEDAKRALPKEVVYEHWREDVMVFFEYLYENRIFVINIFNSNSRLYMLRFLKERLQSCIRAFADIVAKDMNIDRQDFDFVIEFYVNGVIGLISQWLDLGMPSGTVSADMKARFMHLLDNSVENMLGRFQTGK